MMMADELLKFLKSTKRRDSDDIINGARSFISMEGNLSKRVAFASSIQDS